MSRPTVLIVEESSLLRRQLVDWLEGDCRVVGCDSAQMAIENLDRRPADWLILNPLLAPNSGFELLYEIQAHPDLRRVKTILLTPGPNHYGRHRSALACLNIADVKSWSDVSRQYFRQKILKKRRLLLRGCR